MGPLSFYNLHSSLKTTGSPPHSEQDSLSSDLGTDRSLALGSTFGSVKIKSFYTAAWQIAKPGDVVHTQQALSHIHWPYAPPTLAASARDLSNSPRQIETQRKTGPGKALFACNNFLEDHLQVVSDFILKKHDIKEMHNCRNIFLYMFLSSSSCPFALDQYMFAS